MLHLKKFEGLFGGGKFHKIFPKRTPEEIEAENKLKEEEKKKREEEELRLKKEEEEKSKTAKLDKLKELVDPLLKSINGYYSDIKFKEYHTYVTDWGASSGKIGIITLESNLDLEKYLKASDYKPNIKSLSCRLSIRVDIDSSSSNFINVESYSFKLESALHWEYNSKHESIYGSTGQYRYDLSRSYPGWKFETSTGTHQTYNGRGNLNSNITNLNNYSLSSNINSSIKDHLKLTFFYCGVDENNQKYLDNPCLAHSFSDC